MESDVGETCRRSSLRVSTLYGGACARRDLHFFPRYGARPALCTPGSERGFFQVTLRRLWKSAPTFD